MDKNHYCGVAVICEDLQAEISDREWKALISHTYRKLKGRKFGCIRMYKCGSIYICTPWSLALPDRGPTATSPS
jgi:hypothetical protein